MDFYLGQIFIGEYPDTLADWCTENGLTITELEPEEVDENGVGRVLTCIGFRPLEDEIAHTISKKFQLYK
jgi:hypothetical protein